MHSDVTSGHDPYCYYCMFSYVAIFMRGYTQAIANVNKLSLSMARNLGQDGGRVTELCAQIPNFINPRWPKY